MKGILINSFLNVSGCKNKDIANIIIYLLLAEAQD